MAKRARAGAEVDPVDDERGEDSGTGGDAVRADADAESPDDESGEEPADESDDAGDDESGDEPDFDTVESQLNAIIGETGDIPADGEVDGAGEDAAMGDAGVPAAPESKPYSQSDAEYGEYKPDPEERQPGAPPAQYDHYQSIGTDGLTDRGIDLYLASTGYEWPKPGKPVIMPDGDLYTEVGDTYPMLPVFTERNNY
jgi:hypothetical protein